MSPVSANKEGLERANAEATAENTKRADAKGTRIKVGQTRGKNPSVITWEAFDLEKPKTLPESLKEFMSLTSITTEADLLPLVIDGFNAAQYSQASDEIGEYINDAWDKEMQAQFRLVIRNHSKLTGSSIEDTVTLLKPGIEAAWTKKVAAAAQK